LQTIENAQWQQAGIGKSFHSHKKTASTVKSSICVKGTFVGFFFSMLLPTATQPSGAVGLIYIGAVILAISVVTLGIGLVRTPQRV
jgi:hypothetical protein